MRTESVLRGDIAAKAMEDCVACDGYKKGSSIELPFSYRIFGYGTPVIF